VCLGDRASRPQRAIHRPRLIVTRILAGVESESQLDRAGTLSELLPRHSSQTK
jgi:hypothetical protein